MREPIIVRCQRCCARVRALDATRCWTCDHDHVCRICAKHCRDLAHMVDVPMSLGALPLWSDA